MSGKCVGAPSCSSYILCLVAKSTFLKVQVNGPLTTLSKCVCHDGQADVHLKISSTFVKNLERLFTSKNQDNSEKGHLLVSQTSNLNFLPFQGHKNIFSTCHF